MTKFLKLEAGCTLCDPSLEGKSTGGLHVDPSRVCLMFYINDLTVYLYHVTVINLSCECYWMLNPVSPSRQHRMCFLVLGTLKTLLNSDIK